MTTTNSNWMTVSQIAERATLRDMDTTVYVVADNGAKLQVERVERGDKGWYSVFIVGDTTGEPIKRRAGFLLLVEVAESVTVDDKILERVRNLMAKADASQNSNAHEREVAYSMAMKLIAKHNIDERALHQGDSAEPVDTMKFNAWDKNKFEIKEWRFTVMVAVSLMFPVRVLQVGKDTGMWVGTSTNMTLAMFMYQSICNQILAMVDVEAKEASKRGEIAVGHGSKGKDPYAWRKSFLGAAAMGVYERVREMVRKADVETSALVVQMHGEVDSWIDGNMKTGKSKPRSAITGAGARAGVKAADKVNLNTALEADEQDENPLLN
jgi:hypothetical protein